MNKLLTRLQQVLSPVFYKTVFGVSFVTYLFIYLVSLGNIAFNGYQLGAHSIQWSNALR